MTRRTNQTKTTIYRRHAGKCPINGQPNNVTQCECPLWIHGKVRGKFIRESLDTRTLSTAEMRQTNMERGNDDDPTPGGRPQLIGRPKTGNETLEYAAGEFLEAKKGLASSTQDLYRAAIRDFSDWAAKHEITLLREIDTSHIRGYFETKKAWKRSTHALHLTQLRVFFSYCTKTRRWLPYAPTEDPTLTNGGRKGKKAKHGTASTREPFTPAQVTQILAAVEQMPDADRDRARALVYLLLYSGVRISDAAFCERSSLTNDGNLKYHVIKTGKQIDLPPELQKPAVDALAKLPPSRVYFFQPDRDDDYREARLALRDGDGEFSLLMPGYKARIRAATDLVKRVLALAGLEGSCHRFRDTFAINLLVGDGEKGLDIYSVSKMLGHSDVKITDAHYMKLVPGYCERMSKGTRVLSYEFPKTA